MFADGVKQKERIQLQKVGSLSSQFSVHILMVEELGLVCMVQGIKLIQYLLGHVAPHLANANMEAVTSLLSFSLLRW